jgi:hypothetical protein
VSLIEGPLAPSAIETVYAETRFRSRLEARWAVFFDLVGWPWAYEPIDLTGYIPDFVLSFHRPLLVEVKPAVTLADLDEHRRKIEASGWPHEALLVGALLWPSEIWGDSYDVGCLRERMSDDQWWWSGGHLFRCRCCGHISVHHDMGSYRCRVSGCGDGDHHLDDDAALIASLWTEAGNVVRWQRHAPAIAKVAVDWRVMRDWQERPPWCVRSPEIQPPEGHDTPSCHCRECQGLP